jgi:hypothetical protein
MPEGNLEDQQQRGSGMPDPRPCKTIFPNRSGRDLKKGVFHFS